MGIFYPIYKKELCSYKKYDTGETVEYMGDVKTGEYEEKYKGLVLEDREKNYVDDSYFYAVVWDEENNCPINVEYDATAFASSGAYCKVDATNEVRKKFTDWARNQLFEELKKNDYYNAFKLEKGKEVGVVKGRKVPKGTKGKIIWIGESSVPGAEWIKYTKLGIATSEEKNEKGFYKDVVWIDAKNVKLINPDKYFTNKEILLAKAYEYFPKDSIGARYRARFI